ncbi:MAG: 50S ribosomal protein L24 [Bacteroidales bacterium]|jgi:large subunit ribosomal protein L24|nr:50S ribosomal protein L24 [Bacteroidales bacterium]MBR4804395.1 50S ribosomal protein L24 [Bacteroidales bacterium]MBR5029003.1 50S ribosomal protein L24 [Bacteroidales bacterium]
MKLHVKKGDTVKVIAGDDKGSVGRVLKVYPEKNRAIVEGVNIVKKHTKPNAKNTQGGIVEKEAPIHISNLMVMENNVPTRIGRKIDEKTGKLVRYSKKSGEVIK